MKSGNDVETGCEANQAVSRWFWAAVPDPSWLWPQALAAPLRLPGGMMPGNGSNPPPMPLRPPEKEPTAPGPPVPPIDEDETHEKLCGVRIGDETGEKEAEPCDRLDCDDGKPTPPDPAAGAEPLVGIGCEAMGDRSCEPK